MDEQVYISEHVNTTKMSAISVSHLYQFLIHWQALTCMDFLNQLLLLFIVKVHIPDKINNFPDC